MDYPYRFTKTAKQDTSQMQTKQKPQATHICTQRLIEICTDTKRQKHMQTQNVKIIKHNKSYIKQIQDKYLIYE